MAIHSNRTNITVFNPYTTTDKKNRRISGFHNFIKIILYIIMLVVGLTVVVALTLGLNYYYHYYMVSE